MIKTKTLRELVKTTKVATELVYALIKLISAIGLAATVIKIVVAKIIG